ncbi:hypothetical protein TNCT_322601 [Trichonephila clavata]|uniref:Uncharacterized protein n=1 Tax=Trichonephila clavata TaxID=2740835 RepID=A0A8X6J9T1_TRICU|nr:hypothetical protein TNCT_322601 [Trichonephila clavata]
MLVFLADGVASSVTRMLLVSCRGEHQKSFQRQQEISRSNLPTLVRGGMFPCFPNPPLSFPLGVFPFERCPWKENDSLNSSTSNLPTLVRGGTQKNGKDVLSTSFPFFWV